MTEIWQPEQRSITDYRVETKGGTETISADDYSTDQATLTFWLKGKLVVRYSRNFWWKMEPV